MFIPFLAAAAVGIALIKLGALSAWVVILSLALKSALAVILAGLCVTAWHKFSKT